MGAYWRPFFIFVKTEFVKNLLLTAVGLLLALAACKQNTAESTISANSSNIDSINAARTRYNDSIRVLNETNRFGDLTGKHTFKYTSDDSGITMNGTVTLAKSGRDEYTSSGSAKSGKNSVEINGTIKRVSEKHLNFDGTIKQNVNGTPYTRNKKTTFLDEGKGSFWRLQDKVNGNGFVEYIDIGK